LDEGSVFRKSANLFFIVCLSTLYELYSLLIHLFVQLMHTQNARYIRITGLNKTCSHGTENLMNDMYDWNQYCNFGEAQTVSSLMMVYVNRNMLEQVLYF